MPTAAQLTDRLAEHGEGPVWDAAGHQLLSVDLERGVLVRYDPATGGAWHHPVADVLACLRPRTAGGWVAVAERRFATLDVPTGPGGGPLGTSMMPPLWERGPRTGPPPVGVRFNEGACDPQGRFWAGSMAYDQAEGAAALWRLDLDGTARVALGGVTVSNGLAWSTDDTAYYVDTPTGAVDVLTTDPATGAVLDRRVWAPVPEGAGGRPDGLALDAEGGVWVAVFGGGCVLRLDATGRVDERLDVGAAGVTACAFGGDDLDVLYVTTSTQGGDEAAAGALFTHSPGVRGVPALPCAV